MSNEPLIEIRSLSIECDISPPLAAASLTSPPHLLTPKPQRAPQLNLKLNEEPMSALAKEVHHIMASFDSVGMLESAPPSLVIKKMEEGASGADEDGGKFCLAEVSDELMESINNEVAQHFDRRGANAPPPRFSEPSPTTAHASQTGST